ncbi:MAG: 3-hexulose-6-phosphate synthase, partial [Candidatus Nealsonbacteria bacterium]|nr:3-hexulose-6-phosphate synthase [Candidatus Nealsonbacteria bacterium]
MILQKRQRYLQIALNGSLYDAQKIISELPRSERILVEAGTPLIKTSGAEAIVQIKGWAGPLSYVVADIKTADLAPREVEMSVVSGASGVTCLGVSP